VPYPPIVRPTFAHTLAQARGIEPKPRDKNPVSQIVCAYLTTHTKLGLKRSGSRCLELVYRYRVRASQCLRCGLVNFVGWALPVLCSKPSLSVLWCVIRCVGYCIINLYLYRTPLVCGTIRTELIRGVAFEPKRSIAIENENEKIQRFCL